MFKLLRRFLCTEGVLIINIYLISPEYEVEQLLQNYYSKYISSLTHLIFLVLPIHKIAISTHRNLPQFELDISSILRLKLMHRLVKGNRVKNWMHTRFL